MYNLDEKVEGLDVVDFPGVDDRDETISDLADLLLTLSQIVIFVVDYRYVAITVTVNFFYYFCQVMMLLYSFKSVLNTLYNCMGFRT